jgi:hypothetical protein
MPESLRDFATQVVDATPRTMPVTALDERSHARVDYVVWIGGHPVPVEVKQNVLADPRLFEQVRRYTGPATFALKHGVPYTHGVLIAIDAEGVYLFVNGDCVDPMLAPSLARRGFHQADVLTLRLRIADQLN